MYCKKCGKKIPDESIFCKYCGQKISATNEKDISRTSNKNLNNNKESFVARDTISQRIVELYMQDPEHRVALIKKIKEEYGLSIKDAKSIVDDVLSRLDDEVVSGKILNAEINETIDNGGLNRTDNGDEIKQRIIELYMQDPEHKVKLVQKVKEEYGYSITEAKNIVDEVLSEVNKVDNDSVDDSRSVEENNERVSIKTDHSEFANKSTETLLNDYLGIRTKLVEVDRQKNELFRTQVKIQNSINEEEKILNEMDGTIYACYTISAITIIGGLIFLAHIGLIIGIVVFVILSRVAKKHFAEEVLPNNKIKAQEYHESVIEPLLERFEEIKLEIDELWDSDELVLYEKMVPDEYKDMNAINFFVRALEVGRAETQKELFNLYEDELHKQRMVTMQKEMIDKQNEQIQIAKDQNAKLDSISEQQEKSNTMQKKISRQLRYGNAVNTIDLLTAKKVKIK